MARQRKWTPEGLRADGYLPIDELLSRLLDDGILSALDEATLRRLQAEKHIKFTRGRGVRRAGMDALRRNVAFYPFEVLEQIRKFHLLKRMPRPLRQGVQLRYFEEQSKVSIHDRVELEQLMDYGDVIAADKATAAGVQAAVEKDKIPATDIFAVLRKSNISPASPAGARIIQEQGWDTYLRATIEVLSIQNDGVRQALMQRNSEEAFWMSTQMRNLFRELINELRTRTQSKEKE